jgi:hypothetical protein
MVQAFVFGTQVLFQSPTDLTTELSTINGANTLRFALGSTQTSDVDTVSVDDDGITVTDAGNIIAGFSVANLGLGAGTYVVFPDAAVLPVDGGAGEVNALAQNEPALATVDANGVATFKVDTNVTNQSAVKGAVSLVVFKAPVAVRGADNSYVISSGVTDAGTNVDFAVTATDAVKRDVTVQAFVDDFDNNAINAGAEWTSKAVTASFVTRSDVTWTTSLTAPVIGDATLAATMTSSPMINGAENDDDSNFKIAFTRQGSDTVALSADATQSAVTGTWSASVTMALGGNDITSLNTTTGADTAGQNWGQLVAATAPNTTEISIAATGVVTVKTGAAHNLRSGDKITMTVNAADSAVDVAAEAAARTITVTGSDTFTYTVTETGTITAASKTAGLNAGTEFAIVTNGAGVEMVQRVFAGDYSAQAAIEDADGGDFFITGNKSSRGTAAQVAADTVITTAGSATVQGARVNNNTDTTTDAKVKAGALTAEVIATVVDADGVAVGAGRPVTYTQTASVATILVNGSDEPEALYTDANGQVKFTVTDTVGANGTTLTLAVTPEGVSGAQTNFTLAWETQAYTVYDLKTSQASLATDDRYVATGSSYTVGVLVADQWYQAAPADTYRLKVTGSGVTEGFPALTAGRADVVIADKGIGTSFQTNLVVQKLTAGTWADSTTVTLTTKTIAAASALVTLGADGSSLYGSTTADLADLVAAKALVERDTRVAFVAQPVYTNDVKITGKVTAKATGVSLNDAVVTVTGPSNILFSNGAVDARGSITLVADNNGEFVVTLYSTTAQTDTVITVTAAGASSTTKVSFTGIGVGEGTKLDVTAPANVRPASTFQVKAKLSDTFGNGVEAAAGRVKVTYTGPGIVFGTLPDKTDKNGELMFSVLLGSNDTGNVVVTVSYDQNGDADYVDAKDLNTTKTITVGTGAAAGTGKVNVGSFNGKLVVYASGLNGKRISWKVGGNWGSAVASSNYAIFNRPTPRAGVTVSVDIYVDGVKTLTKSVVTR